MNTAQKLKRCNRWLGIGMVLILASGIQLEATASSQVWSVWAHIILGIAFTALSIYHIYLHYRHSDWFKRFAKNRNLSTRILWWAFLLTMVSGIAASTHWLSVSAHSPLGGVHGKIGFLMIIAAAFHIAGHLSKKKRTR